MNIEQLAKQAAKSTQPQTSILSPAFVYTPAAQHVNDPDYLRKKFAAIREQQQAKPANVRPIKRKSDDMATVVRTGRKTGD